MTQPPPWKHSGMTCMTGVLHWMAVSFSQGTGKEGGVLECLCPLGTLSTLQCSSLGMISNNQREGCQGRYF